MSNSLDAHDPSLRVRPRPPPSFAGEELVWEAFAMKLKVAIQMDHVSTIDIDGDSTFVLGLEAERRGYEVWHYTPPDLTFRDRKVTARAQPMKLRREKGSHYTLG